MNSPRTLAVTTVALALAFAPACAQMANIAEGVAQGLAAQQPPVQQPVESFQSEPEPFAPGCAVKSLFVHNSNQYPIQVDALQRSGKRFHASVAPFSRNFIAQLDQADLTLYWSALRFQDDPGHQHQMYRRELACQATCLEAVAYGHDTSFAECGAPR